jgi:hypothetical protein
MDEKKRSPWEIDPELWARALARREAEELAEGASFPGGRPFPVVHREIDLSPPATEFFTVNDRPVKLVPTSEGGLDVQALDMRTGEFERDMGYLTRCIAGEGEVDRLTEAEFDLRVRDIRARLAPRDDPGAR